MRYRSKVVGGISHAGWGYILVSDLPDTGRAGIMKKVLQDAGETELEFECEGHDGCPDCEYAWPLIKYDERSSPKRIYLEITTNVVEEADTATISFEARASSNSTYSCPSWRDDYITVTWDLMVTKTGEGAAASYEFEGYIDGNRVFSNTHSSSSIGHAGSAIANAIKDSIAEDIRDRLNDIANYPLNGTWPQIESYEVNDLVDSAISTDDISFEHNSHGSVDVPVKTTNGRQGFYYGGGEAWKKRTVELKINKTVKNKNQYSNNFFNLPEYDLTGTKFQIFKTQTSTSPITDLNGNTAVMTISSATGGNSNTVTLTGDWGDQTVYLQETLPAKATGYKTQYNKAGERLAITLPSAGEAMVKDVENEPIADPVALRIKKVSPNTDGEPIADIDYNGIKYTLSYFGNDTSAKSNAYANRSSVNDWVFATKEINNLGQIDFATESYKVSGPALYKVNGQPQYPVGWYRIQENQDQTEFIHNKGLEVSKDIYYVHIEPIKDPAPGEDDHKFTVYKGNEEYINPINHSTISERREGEIYEKEHWEPFAFVKKDIYLSSGKPEGDTELEGAVFTVYSEDSNRFGSSTEYDGHTYSIGSGNVVLVDGRKLTISIDANGKGICEYPLPKTENATGKRFYIKETTAPLGYKANDTKYYIDYQNRRTVRDYNGGTVSLSIKNMETNATENTSSIYSVADGGTVKNTPRKGSIEIEKFDDDI